MSRLFFFVFRGDSFDMRDISQLRYSRFRLQKTSMSFDYKSPQLIFPPVNRTEVFLFGRVSTVTVCLQLFVVVLFFCFVWLLTWSNMTIIRLLRSEEILPW